MKFISKSFIFSTVALVLALTACGTPAPETPNTIQEAPATMTDTQYLDFAIENSKGVEDAIINLTMLIESKSDNDTWRELLREELSNLDYHAKNYLDEANPPEVFKETHRHTVMAMKTYRQLVLIHPVEEDELTIENITKATNLIHKASEHMVDSTRSLQ